MRKKLDIIGERYGRLIVLKEIEPNIYPRKFLCKCDCGKEIETLMSSLRNGNTLSCGCLQRERAHKANFTDISNQKFERLTVLERVDNYRERYVVWKCKCECGNIVNVLGFNLKNGNVKSCGCLRKEMYKRGMNKKNNYS